MTSTSFSYPVYQLLRKENHQLADLFAFKNVGRLNVTAEGEAEVLQADLVSGNFYQQMEVQPQLGRAIGPADDNEGASPVAVISDGYWTRRFNRSPEVIGKTILVNLVNVTIVGRESARASPEPRTCRARRKSLCRLPRSRWCSPYRNDQFPADQRPGWWMQIMARAKPGVDEAKGAGGSRRGAAGGGARDDDR